MIKNIYLILVTIVAMYFAFIKEEKPLQSNITLSREDSIFIFDSLINSEADKKVDSFSKSLVKSDQSVSGKIQKAATTITNLKTEVSSLKTIIKEKDKQINELKSTINDFTSSINSKFRIFAIDSQDRK
jgi:predicted RNase H-like nuclease (RuvC/YqgF family)